MNKVIKKAVLPIAGLGTRLLPATKSQPKAMLPIYNKPAIQYVVEEAMKVGINNFLFITRKNQISVKNYFAPSPEIMEELKRKNNLPAQKILEQDIFKKISCSYIEQPQQLGSGDAIKYAESFVGEDSFLVLLADDIIDEKSNFINNLEKCYEKYNSPVIGVKRIKREEIKNYGIIEGLEIEKNVFEIKKMYEKPALEDTSSNLAIVGRYVLTPDIFRYLKKEKEGVGGEIQLTGALQKMLKSKKMYAIMLEDERYDVGTLEGLFLANLAYYIKNSKEKNNLIEKIEIVLQNGKVNKNDK